MNLEIDRVLASRTPQQNRWIADSLVRASPARQIHPMRRKKVTVDHKLGHRSTPADTKKRILFYIRAPGPAAANRVVTPHNAL
jgi:hypothetical protein